MKSLAIISIAFASAVFANTTEPVKQSENNHHLSFGPDVFWQHFSEDKEGVETESNGVFGGARLRYEYAKQDGFYAGTDAMFAAGRVKDKLETTTQDNTTNHTALAANLEQRFGYTVGVRAMKRSSVTPFLGLGWYYSRPFVDNQFSNDFVYATAGLNSSCEVSDNFALGVTGKALYSFYDRTHVAGVVNSTWDDTAWGFEVDVPMTWHLNQAHTWDMTFEPYIQDLDVSNNYMNVGGRLMASYQF